MNLKEWEGKKIFKQYGINVPSSQLIKKPENIELKYPWLVLKAQIPVGRVATYKGLATAAGNSRAYRAVGSILANNPLPIEIPCHRVVRSDGHIGGYSQGRELKRKLLRMENVEIRDDAINLKTYLIDFSV